MQLLIVDRLSPCLCVSVVKTSSLSSGFGETRVEILSFVLQRMSQEVSNLIH